MAKMVIAVPNQMMLEQAVNAKVKLKADAEILLVSNENVVEQVTRARERGAVVAVARGHHAHLLQQQTGIPPVEIVLSGQNLALLFAQAKKMIAKPLPRIALIGSRNMFSDFSAPQEVLGIDAHAYFAAGREELRQAVENARRDCADGVIGGETVTAHAAKCGLPCLFLNSTQDSIESAIAQAKRMIYAIELEKHKKAEFSTLLNFSFDAIVRLDDEGQILDANYIAEKIFRRNAAALKGNNIHSLLRTNQQALIANLAPIHLDGESMGFLLTLQEFGKIEELEEQMRKECYRHGYVATHHFADEQNHPVAKDEEIRHPGIFR